MGVRFKRTGSIYYFDPSNIELAAGDDVVVETARGQAIGKVVVAAKEVTSAELSEPLKPVLRKAQPDDLEQMKKMKEKEA